MLFKFANWVESVVKGISLKKRVIFLFKYFCLCDVSWGSRFFSIVTRNLFCNS